MNRKINGKISPLTIERLTIYLRFLKRLKSQNIDNIFSHELADKIGISVYNIRKDISQFGQFGKINSGYNVNELIDTLSDILGVDKNQDVVIVGAGNVGRALMGYNGFLDYGFNIKAVFDSDENKINRVISGIRCYAIGEIEKVVKENNIKLGIICVPAYAAQNAADTLVQAGIVGVLNFASVILKLPEHVKLIEVNFISKLETLSYYAKSINKE